MPPSIEELNQGSQRVLELLYHSQVSGKGFADTKELASTLAKDLALVAACCRRLHSIGQVNVVSNRGGDEMLVRITPEGMRAAEKTERYDTPLPSALTQNFHGSVGIVATQVGSHNTMTPQQRSGGTVEEFALLLTQLRSAVATLPEDDHDEVNVTIESLNKGVQEDRLERVGRAVETLSKVGSASATFLTSLKAISKLFGLNFPGSDS